jgi:hypothetical protein
MPSKSIKKLIKLGKAQAREQFAPLVESLSQSGGIIEVTNYGKVAAVMLSYQDYLHLLARASEPFQPKRQLAGSAVLVGNLEKTSEKISQSVLNSVRKSAREL